jgi:hypothetical protein
MKAEIVIWAGGCKDQLASLGYSDKEVVEVDELGLRNLVFHIFETGLNVMVRHAKDGKGIPTGDVLVFVDYGSFSQR